MQEDMSNTNSIVDDFIHTIEELTSSLKESVCDAKTISGKWECFDKFMIDMEKLAAAQPMTSRKSFLLKDILSNGGSKDMDGNTKYLKHFASMPIMVNSIIGEDGTLSPSRVCEMHVGNVEGQLCLLVTPEIIGR